MSAWNSFWVGLFFRFPLSLRTFFGFIFSVFWFALRKFWVTGVVVRALLDLLRGRTVTSHLNLDHFTWPGFTLSFNRWFCRVFVFRFSWGYLQIRSFFWHFCVWSILCGVMWAGRWVLRMSGVTVRVVFWGLIYIRHFHVSFHTFKMFWTTLHKGFHSFIKPSNRSQGDSIETKLARFLGASDPTFCLSHLFSFRVVFTVSQIAAAILFRFRILSGVFEHTIWVWAFFKSSGAFLDLSVVFFTSMDLLEKRFGDDELLNQLTAAMSLSGRLGVCFSFSGKNWLLRLSVDDTSCFV